MTFTVDPQVAAILAPMAEAMAAAPHPAVGDIATRRVALEAVMAETAALQPTPADVTVTGFHAVAGGFAYLYAIAGLLALMTLPGAMVPRSC